MPPTTPPATGSIPVPIAQLLVSYFCNTATLAERLQLDNWILESDFNMEVFEECLEESLRPVQYDPDRPEESALTNIPLN